MTGAGDRKLPPEVLADLVARLRREPEHKPTGDVEAAGLLHVLEREDVARAYAGRILLEPWEVPA